MADESQQDGGLSHLSDEAHAVFAGAIVICVMGWFLVQIYSCTPFCVASYLGETAGAWASSYGLWTGLRGGDGPRFCGRAWGQVRMGEGDKGNEQ